MSKYAPDFFLAYLSTALNAGEPTTDVVLDRLTTLTGEVLETSDLAELGAGFITVNPQGDGKTSYPEIIKFTGVTSATNTLTGCTRGLTKDSVADTSLMRYASVGTPVILSFGVQQIGALVDYLNSLTFSTRQVLVTGVAGETLTAGQAVYFKVSDGRWWLTDASAVETSQGLLLGIAQGTGTAGNTITTGVMLFGRDTNQSGLTGGEKLYLSDTAGALSNTAGTYEMLVGQAYDATSLYFNPMIGIVLLTNIQTLRNKTFENSYFQIGINEQTADYTLVLTDKSKMVQMNVATANTLTIPTNADVAFPIGTKILVQQLGAGVTTIAGDTGVTVNSTDGALNTNGQYACAVVIQTAIDVWQADGNLTT